MVLLVGVGGKRNAGKDTLSLALKDRLAKVAPHVTCELGTVAQLFKKQFADKFGYDFQKLLNDRAYKEAHREEMISYFHQLEQEDPQVDEKWWIQLLNTCPSQVLIAPDVRLKTDLVTLQTHAKSRYLVKINCTPEVRQKLGWKFSQNVDADKTETDLDEFKDWDYELENSGTRDSIDFHAEKLAENVLKLL